MRNDRTKTDIGGWLKAGRKAKRLTLHDLSLATKGELSVSYLSRLENNQRDNPSIQKLSQIALLLDLDISEVVDLPKMVDHEQERANEELQKLIDTLMEQLERASKAFDQCVPGISAELAFSEAKQALEDAMKTCVFLIYKIKS
jgi:transcriptional regulator with XRE-family HTH domain